MASLQIPNWNNLKATKSWFNQLNRLKIPAVGAHLVKELNQRLSGTNQTCGESETWTQDNQILSSAP